MAVRHHTLKYIRSEQFLGDIIADMLLDLRYWMRDKGLKHLTDLSLKYHYEDNNYSLTVYWEDF